MIKRIISVVTALLLALTMALPAMAAENFVPSVSYKPVPEIVPVVDENGDSHIGVILEDDFVIDYVDEDCLVITPISRADCSTEIPEDSRTVLKDVYSDLTDGSMTIPYAQLGVADSDRLVIRDLFDASWLCVEHPEIIEPEGVVLQLTFDLGIAADDPIYVFTYKNDQWNNIASVVNNGDGTVTCTFEHLCPIAFVVDADTYLPPIKTGDNIGNLGVWFGVMAVSGLALIAIAVTVFVRKNRSR